MIRFDRPFWRVLRASCLAPCVLGLLLSACSPAAPLPTQAPTQTQTPIPTAAPTLVATPLPTREIIAPGQLLPYVTQTGDTVTSLAAHFNTSAKEILTANPQLPMTATLPPGQALQIPAYYFPLGGPTFKIIPDSEFVYGPANKDFDVAKYLASQPGYLRTLSAFAADRQRTSADTIQYVAEQYSINPKLLLALLEWRSGALTKADVPPETIANPLGLAHGESGFYLQTLWAAEQLSIGYYGWRAGTLTTIQFQDTYSTRVDMYQNAGTVGVQYLLAQMFPHDEFDALAGPDGFAKTYYALWGNPWTADPPEVIPGNLTQPELSLPFASGQTWSLTGGPHPGWGNDLPWSALDFGPPGVTGCADSALWVTASAPGVVVRAGDNSVVLDLDGDGHEQTGWVLFYFHMAERDQIAAGTKVKVGDPLGHPSCEGGRATGTHVHMARKYNGEWIPADGIVPGIVPFVIGGWTAERGDVPYQGRLTRLGAWVEACTCSTAANKVYWAP
jgi:LasA protease